MPERRIVIGALATLGALILTLTFFEALVEGKLNPLAAISYVVALAIVILGIMLAFCYFYYGETPLQVVRRVKAEERRIAREAAQRATRK